MSQASPVELASRIAAQTHQLESAGIMCASHDGGYGGDERSCAFGSDPDSISIGSLAIRTAYPE